MSNPWIAAAALIGAIIGDIPRQEQEYQKQGELSHPNSLTNKALKAQKDASQTIGRIHYSFVPAPNPLMNGPSMLLGGLSRKDLPPTETPGEAFAVVAAINEANAYLEATGQIESRPRTKDNYSLNDEYGNLIRYNGVAPDEMTYGLNTEYDHLMRANRALEIAAMQPQSMQVITQPAAAPRLNRPLTLISPMTLRAIGKIAGRSMTSANISRSRSKTGSIPAVSATPGTGNLRQK